MSSRKRKDSNSFLLSQRSNGLLFSHHHFPSISAGSTSRRLHGTVLSQIDGNAPARPREKLSVSLMSVSEHSKEDTHIPITIISRQPIRSLIPPITPMRCKTSPNTIRRRRNSSSSASIKSITSSLLSRRRKSAMSPLPTLATMPAEILSIIFSSLPQSSLHALMLSNSNFVEVAATYMYSHPIFASTYRFAQFVWEVSQKPHCATMVRVLDLSYFSKMGCDSTTGELLPLAGWREWKYRNHDMHLIRLPSSSPISTSNSMSNGNSTTHGSGNGNSNSKEKTTHPPPSQFLKSYHRTRDIPIGALGHILLSCPRLRHLNLSRVQLGADFLILSPHFAKASLSRTSHLLFVSDVPKSWTWANNDLEPVYADEIVKWVCRLRELEVLKARNCLWLSTVRVERLLREANRGEHGGLRKVDFRESGMQRDVRWAVKGERGVVERIVREVVENTREG